MLTLSVSGGNAGSATLLNRNDQAFSAVARVPVRPLSDYGNEIGLNRIDFVKIDVEGFEAQVIAGARAIFAKLKPKIVLFEEHSTLRLERLPPSIAALSDLGYQIFGLPRHIGRPNLVPIGRLASARVTDYVAISRENTECQRARLGIEGD